MAKIFKIAAARVAAKIIYKKDTARFQSLVLGKNNRNIRLKRNANEFKISPRNESLTA